MKIFISVPMRGKTDEEILCAIEEAKQIAISYKPFKKETLEFVDTFTKDKPPVGKGNLWYLGRALQMMDGCDAILMCPNWIYARGCLIENNAAKEYGLDVYDISEVGTIRRVTM